MNITKELLERYYAGLCTSEEKKAVDEWLKLNNDIPTDFPMLGRENIDSDKIWSKLSKDIPELTNVPIGQKPRIISLQRNILRYAAVAVILLTVGITTIYFTNPKSIFSTEETIAYQTVQTRWGEKRTVNLPDGSTIRLNYGTQVRIPEAFVGNERIVHLSGHAHFDVKRNPEKPFIIYTEGTKTQVLGTSFDINTNNKALGTEVIVTSGKVAFSEKNNADNLVTLAVNQRAVINNENTIAVNEVNAQRLTAWKTDRIVFDDATFDTIIKVLEPWYNVQIRVENNQLLEERLTLSYDNPPLDKMLDRMSKMIDFEYRMEGEAVIIQ